MKIRIMASSLLALGFLVISSGPSLAWDVESELDDFGSPAVFARTYFMQGVGNTDSFDTAYDNGDYEALYVRCQDKQLEVYVTSKNKLFADSSSALVKFGNGSAKTWTVSRSTDQSAIFLYKTSSLIASMKKVSKFYLRADGSEGYLTANFNVKGLSKYSSTFKKAGCKI